MTNQPLFKLRDGLLTATVWENIIGTETGEQTRHSVEISRSYSDGKEWKTTNSFSPTDLLKLARLAERAYDRLLDHRQNNTLG